MYSSSNQNPCHLLLLVGLKGAGKTFVGDVLERSLAVKFLRIEPLFLELMRQEPELQGIALEQRGFQLVLDEVDAIAQTHPLVCMESTGAAYTFVKWLAALRQGYRVSLIYVHAPLETCIERVKNRDASAHIPVSDHRLREINAVAQLVELPWDLELDNSTLLNEAAIATQINAYLQHK